MFWVLTASVMFLVVSTADLIFLNMLKNVKPLLVVSSSKLRPVCLEVRASFCLNTSAKAGSKLSSWLPAITILCLWGNVPKIHFIQTNASG